MKTFISLFSGCGGMDLGLERAGFKCKGQIEIMPYALKILKKQYPKIPKHTDISTFCVRGGLVRGIQSQARGRVCSTKGADSGKKWQGVCEYLIRNGFLERMFPGFYPLMAEGTFQKLSATCKKSGMAFCGEYLTLNTSESPRDADVCSLSDILETSVHPKYYLTKKAVSGMIRRSKKWGRGGYVFLQETGQAKTQQMKLLSLQQLESIVTGKEAPLNLREKTLSLKQYKRKKEIDIIETKTSLAKHSEQQKGATLPLYGKTLILRKLTPNEKESLQGFSDDWTLCEE